jgi:hypothetical protein
MVNRTGGNRSGYRGIWSYGLDRFWFRPVPTGPNLKFELKKWKISQNSQNTSRCVQSNGVKNFQIFVHLVYFADIRSSTKKKKRKNWPVELLVSEKNTKWPNILKSFDTIKLYAPCNIFRKFSYCFNLTTGFRSNRSVHRSELIEQVFWIEIWIPPIYRSSSSTVRFTAPV